ncbi:MAG TPA: hypothetical protein VGL06_20635 [Pseudonocardiaceae bacterium]
MAGKPAGSPFVHDTSIMTHRHHDMNAIERIASTPAASPMAESRISRQPVAPRKNIIHVEPVHRRAPDGMSEYGDL